MTEWPTVYEHYRPVDGVAEPGVYRVVGTPDGTVTLLRVADEHGHRLNTGQVESYAHETFAEEFESAENPDGTGRLGRALSGVGVGFLVVAALSWLELFVTPAPPATLAVIGVGALLAGRVVGRVRLPSIFD